MDEMNSTAIVFVALVVLGAVAFVFKKPQIMNAIKGTSKTNVPVVSTAAKAANKVFHSADDLLRYTDDVFYGSKESLKEISNSPTAIPVAIGTGSAIGYVVYKNGKEVIIVSEKEKDWLPPQTQQVFLEAPSKTGLTTKEAIERARAFKKE